MKQKAILYTRVSTDEQNNGYSPADQKERLINYAEKNGIDIVGVFHDDESAKTFNRPQWLNIMEFIKRNKGAVDTILFIKWDRFSRNVAEAYIAIRELKKYGVEAHAIEQPLNFEIPESKIMLSIYLAVPEVDNDRRALNIFHGIRKGKKEGRLLGGCPRGYKNARDDKNRPIVIPEGGKMERLVKETFTLFATGNYPIENLRRKMVKEGLKISRQSFWMLLRNKAYIGKVFLPAYKDECAVWVNGQHPAIIDEKTFYDAQDVLTGRKKNVPEKNSKVRAELPLRGYLICPQCGGNISGSASTGHRGGKFFYYHCTKGCRERRKATELNNDFLAYLKKYAPNAETVELYGEIIKQTFKANNGSLKDELTEINKSIEKQNERLKNARLLMLDAEISADDYKLMKADINETLEKLQVQQIQLKGGNENYDAEIDICVKVLKNLESLYNTVDTEGKQQIVGSVFPERLIFDNNGFRTPRINRVISLMCNKTVYLPGAKKRKHAKSDALSVRVVSPRIELGSKV